MTERLSQMVDQSLRNIARLGAAPTRRELVIHLQAVSELLQEVGIFARDLERTEAQHAGEPMRQLQERNIAAERLYARLVDPPHADNVVSIPIKGIGRILLLESRTL